jgi:hypothetical protein
VKVSLNYYKVATQFCIPEFVVCTYKYIMDTIMMSILLSEKAGRIVSIIYLYEHTTNSGIQNCVATL